MDLTKLSVTHYYSDLNISSYVMKLVLL